MNPSLKIAFKQGHWHHELCDDIMAEAWNKPTSSNLILALDAMHSIRGVTPAIIDRVDELITDRLLTHWPVYYRLCSFDITQQRFQRLDARLQRSTNVLSRFSRDRTLSKFPRVLDHFAKHHSNLNTLRRQSQCAEKLLKSTSCIQDTLNRIPNLVNGCSVAVVGNGPSLQDSAAGHEIDNRDVVIRFNNSGVNDVYDEDLGGKTNLWVLSPSAPTDSRKMATTELVITGPDPWTRPSHYWKSLAPFSTTTFNINRWHALVKQLSAPPSGGMLMIDALRQAGVKPSSMFVYGFDRLSNSAAASGLTNHYRDNQPLSSRHNWAAEAQLFQRLIQE